MKIKDFIYERKITIKELADSTRYQHTYLKNAILGNVPTSRKMNECFEQFMNDRLFDEERGLVGLDKIPNKLGVRKPALPPILNKKSIPAQQILSIAPKDVMLSILDELKKLVMEHVK